MESIYTTFITSISSNFQSRPPVCSELNGNTPSATMTASIHSGILRLETPSGEPTHKLFARSDAEGEARSSRSPGYVLPILTVVFVLSVALYITCWRRHRQKLCDRGPRSTTPARPRPASLVPCHNCREPTATSPTDSELTPSPTRQHPLNPKTILEKINISSLPPLPPVLINELSFSDEQRYPSGLTSAASNRHILPPLSNFACPTRNKYTAPATPLASLDHKDALEEINPPSGNATCYEPPMVESAPTSPYRPPTPVCHYLNPTLEKYPPACSSTVLDLEIAATTADAGAFATRTQQKCQAGDVMPKNYSGELDRTEHILSESSVEPSGILLCDGLVPELSVIGWVCGGIVRQ